MAAAAGEITNGGDADSKQQQQQAQALNYVPTYVQANAFALYNTCVPHRHWVLLYAACCCHTYARDS